MTTTSALLANVKAEHELLKLGYFKETCPRCNGTTKSPAIDYLNCGHCEGLGFFWRPKGFISEPPKERPKPGVFELLPGVLFLGLVIGVLFFAVFHAFIH